MDNYTAVERVVACGWDTKSMKLCPDCAGHLEDADEFFKPGPTDKCDECGTFLGRLFRLTEKVVIERTTFVRAASAEDVEDMTDARLKSIGVPFSEKVISVEESNITEV